MKTKYYSGPDGVFYAARMDKIVLLVKRDGYYFNFKLNRKSGDMYDVYYSKTNVIRNAALYGCHKNFIRLGDL